VKPVNFHKVLKVSKVEWPLAANCRTAEMLTTLEGTAHEFRLVGVTNMWEVDKKLCLEAREI
jgi:hypothetical protein